jgi:two-component system NtrC family sensor kinase
MWFKRLSWYQRLGTRISILTGILVILFISIYTLISIHNQRNRMIDEVIRNVSMLGETVKLSSREDMLQYSPERLHHLVDTIGNQHAIQKVRIFNSLGAIIYSSEKPEMGRNVDKLSEQCYKCHAAEKPLERLDTPERARIFTSPRGDRVLGMITPIYNEPDCWNARCHTHDPEQKVLGVLDIDVSLRPMDERLRTAELKLVAIGVFSVFLVALVIKFLMGRVLNQPLNELVEGTFRVAHEDLDFKIPVHTDDELGHLALSFNNMTQELKKAKLSLQQWGSRLEQMVDERTRDLRDAQEQLIRSAKLASLGKLSAGVAHEINNPLTGILTFSQLLMEQFPPDSSEYHDLQVIRQETIRCRNIVRGLLEFARQSVPAKSPVRIPGLLDEVLRMVSNQESFQNIRIETRLDPDVPEVMADRDQLKQVFFNVILNASDAMPDGGRLIIETSRNPERSTVSIRFSDTGSGIDPEHLDKLFDPFFTTKQMGTGLGLAVSYGIVKAHRGSIEVESTPGKGTVLTITLPCEKEPAAAEEPAQAATS